MPKKKAKFELYSGLPTPPKSGVKIFVFDVETAFHIAPVWGKYDQMVPALIHDKYLLSWAGCWYEDGKKPRVVCKALDDYPTYADDPTNDKMLTQELIHMVEQADVIVAYNGKRFDVKIMNTRALANDLPVPMDVPISDPLLISRSRFQMWSNKLDDLATFLDLDGKLSTGGISLWMDIILHQCPKAWKIMKAYNKKDVILLCEVYKKLRPWDKNPALKRALVRQEAGDPECPHCGSTNIEFRGYRYTKVSRFRRFQCKESDCGGWGSARLADKNIIKPEVV